VHQPPTKSSNSSIHLACLSASYLGDLFWQDSFRVRFDSSVSLLSHQVEPAVLISLLDLPAALCEVTLPSTSTLYSFHP